MSAFSDYTKLLLDVGVITREQHDKLIEAMREHDRALIEAMNAVKQKSLIKTLIGW